jgi:hypothetical protein
LDIPIHVSNIRARRPRPGKRRKEGEEGRRKKGEKERKGREREEKEEEKGGERRASLDVPRPTYE